MNVPVLASARATLWVWFTTITSEMNKYIDICCNPYDYMLQLPMAHHMLYTFCWKVLDLLKYIAIVGELCTDINVIFGIMIKFVIENY